MNIVITGVAGFIGSNLAEHLLGEGHEVIGIDNLNGYYPVAQKQRNLVSLLNHPSFQFFQCDLAQTGPEVFRDAEVVFHLAGQPGVRHSWGVNFREYTHNNIEATQVLLEHLSRSRSVRRLVFASTSSVYGNGELPWGETAPPCPISPYGVSKLTAEHLCATYSRTAGLSVVCLRYFTAYGPRQRPDMAFHRFFRAGMRGEKITVFGDGSQTRDFTFVGDIVRATGDAGFANMTNLFTIMNVGSGRRYPLTRVLDMIGEIMGRKLTVEYAPGEKGDMRDTFADISRAEKLLSYSPSTGLAEGLEAQYRWMLKYPDPLFPGRAARQEKLEKPENICENR